MEFREYLRQKKINNVSFLQGDAPRYLEWQQLFEQLHPDSFTAQKKFWINKIRKLYPIVNQ